MMNAFRLLFCFFCCFFSLIQANPSDPSPALENSAPFNEPVEITLLSGKQTLSPNQASVVALKLKIEDSWHAYWKNPGDSGMTPLVSWTLPEGFTAGDLQWPTPERFEVDSYVGFGYEKELILLSEITPNPSYSGNPVEITANIRWVVCNDSTCLPGESEAKLTFPSTQNLSANRAIINNAQAALPTKCPENLSIKHTKQGIELSVPNPDKSKIKTVNFFPEHSTVSYAMPAIESTDSHCVVTLKENAKTDQLKGVLQISTEDKTFVYAISHPVDRAPPLNEIAFKEVKKLSADTNVSEEAAVEFEGGLGFALLLAFLGGALLNLMPCVLPVISFKVLSFVKLAGESRRLILRQGLAFSLGVLVSFWALAGLLLVLQAYGRSVGWGFQLQEPLFVAVLAALIFIFSLSLFGLFEMGTSLIGAAGQAEQSINKKNQLFSSFLSGVLATAVATPCTGPFLGSAVGFAVTLPPFQAMLIFTFLGLGMSFPYLVISAYPNLLRFLPKPGAWMVTFKELMAFFMLATVLWLLWVFGAQTGSFALSILLAGFFLLAFASWIYGRWCTIVSKKTTRLLSGTIAAAIFVLGCYVINLSASTWAEKMGGFNSQSTTVSDAGAVVEWETFSPQRVKELREKGVPVFIDFTAKWCLICQANHLVLSAEDVAEKFKTEGVVRMKADWTRRDEVITKELAKLGRNSVPLYVYYSTDSEKPKILPQVLTPDIVMLALKQVDESL